MFIGHFGAALAAKRLTPYTSLGTLIIAVQWLDLMWPTPLMLGVGWAMWIDRHRLAVRQWR